jgi:DNA polymerase-1
MSRDCLYIIDTFSLMFQVFHAIPPMTGTQGQPTNAVFGFTRDLFAIRERGPAYLVCAFDSPGPGKRDELYDRYKANRTAIPEDLVPQISLIKKLVEGFRIPVIECPGWEADDVIATVTREAVERGLEVVIVSTDKDARQLLGPNVRMLNCRKNTFLDEAGLLEDWGVRPDQVVDFQSLVGDSVDNVPGVPKVGPKTAKSLIEQFGTLDNVLANDCERICRWSTTLMPRGYMTRISKRCSTCSRCWDFVGTRPTCARSWQWLRPTSLRIYLPDRLHLRRGQRQNRLTTLQNPRLQ